MSLARAWRAVTVLCITALIGAASLEAPLASAATKHEHAAPRLRAGTPGTMLPGTRCPAFPADNVWNTPVTGLAVDANSATWLASMNAGTTFLHPDYGPSSNPTKPYGIPWVVVAARTKFTTVKFLYASESDRRPYPLTDTTPIEGGSDRHALMVTATKSAASPACNLFETYDTYYRANGPSTVGSGAIWNLDSNALRPAGFTSADAAGLPILPGLVNYDEVRSGAMNHAIRFAALLPLARAPPSRSVQPRLSAHGGALPTERVVFATRLDLQLLLPDRCHHNEDVWSDPRRQRQQLVLPRNGRQAMDGRRSRPTEADPRQSVRGC